MTKQSAETIAKRSASLKAAWADPERRAKWSAAAAAGNRRWHADPDNAKIASARSSERMKRRHADPEWQKVRDERSSRTMKATWEKRRDQFVAQAVERYLRMERNGTGLCDPDVMRRKAIASKWIMKKAQEALHNETDYNEIYVAVQARLRREMPYDGPQDGSEYMDYLQRLGRATVTDPELRKLSDTFLSASIPRFAEDWRREKCSDAQSKRKK